jgi:hypothetical protein
VPDSGPTPHRRPSQAPTIVEVTCPERTQHDPLSDCTFVNHVLVIPTCFVDFPRRTLSLAPPIPCTLTACPSRCLHSLLSMPKTTSPNVSPSKKKKCPVCKVQYHIRGFTSHIKKCNREREERKGDRRYMKELKRLRLAAESEANTGMSTVMYQTCKF